MLVLKDPMFDDLECSEFIALKGFKVHMIQSVRSLILLVFRVQRLEVFKVRDSKYSKFTWINIQRVQSLISKRSNV